MENDTLDKCIDTQYEKVTDNQCRKYADSQLENRATTDGHKIMRSCRKEEIKNNRLSCINGEIYRQVRVQHDRKEKKDLESNKKIKITVPWEQIFPVIVVMCIGRFLRTVNQTGNKWLDIPDLGDWLVRYVMV